MARKKTKTLATQNKITSIKVEETEYNLSIPNGNDLTVNSIQADNIDCASIDVDNLVVNSHLAVGGIKSTTSDRIYVSNGETGSWKTLTVNTQASETKKMFKTFRYTMTMQEDPVEQSQCHYFYVNGPLDAKSFYLVYGDDEFENNTQNDNYNYSCYGILYCSSSSTNSSPSYFRGRVGYYISPRSTSTSYRSTTNTLNFVKLWSIDSNKYEDGFYIIESPTQTVSYE